MVLQDGSGEHRWWTFAGGAANHTLGAALGGLAHPNEQPDNLTVPLEDGATAEAVQSRLREIAAAGAEESHAPVNEEALRGLKFAVCLPQEQAVRILARRRADPAAVQKLVRAPVRQVVGQG